MRRASIGEQEMEVLHFVAEHAPISVGEVFRQFGEPRQLSRSTILTIMERLRKKGYLQRDQDGGAYRYSPRQAKGEMLQALVSRFVERTLNGSVSPFTLYLAQRQTVTPKELEELKALVESLEARQKENPS